jgi:transcriptional regulator with XRE-family HTH domain
MPHERPGPALPAAIRSLREAKGVTRSAGDAGGGTNGTLAGIAKSSPSWGTFRRIAAALDLSISELAYAIEAIGHRPAPKYQSNRMSRPRRSGAGH